VSNATGFRRSVRIVDAVGGFADDVTKSSDVLRPDALD
jgi:hypothetical protein